MQTLKYVDIDKFKDLKMYFTDDILLIVNKWSFKSWGLFAVFLVR